MPPDFDNGFRSAPERLAGEQERRVELERKALSFKVGYLDDCCRRLMPHDLVVIGAKTGAGKTTLAEIIALENAKQGKHVHYFALEAEPDEIERHLKFRWLATRCHIRGFNYPDWYLGRYDADLVFRGLSKDADGNVAEDYATLHTYYKNSNAFAEGDITKLFLHVRNDTDLIILDHLHYVDTPSDVSENRAQKDITKAIRDCALSIGVPIIVVVHLRKRSSRAMLLPDLDDVMGSSDITKIATRVILLAPARDQSTSDYDARPTYMTVAKDRLCGSTNTVALVTFYASRGVYGTTYSLGYMDLAGENFTLLSEAPPPWATNCKRGYG